MDKLAEKLSQFFGSTPFIIVHIIWFTVWTVFHLTLKFDPDWNSLTIIVSLEAIILALFILRAENIQDERVHKMNKEQLDDIKEVKEKIDGQ